MLRDICPWCNRMVSKTDSDQIKSVNGRGMFKTEIYAHRSCYEKWKTENIRRSKLKEDNHAC